MLPDWDRSKIFFFYDGLRCLFLVGEQSGSTIRGKLRGEMLNQKFTHFNFKETMASHDMRLYTGTENNGQWRDSNKRVVLVPYFPDGEMSRQAPTQAWVKNEILMTRVQALERLTNWQRQKIFSLTGKDSFDEAMVERAKSYADVKRHLYPQDQFGGGYLGRYSGGYYPYRSSYGVYGGNYGSSATATSQQTE